ncbi:MAG: hypothetical protein CBB71_19305 [Rhodopirellula sp. TMED11]|nr:MAG: hypothetical protein CBB71_19305 [Rhodopirellula sp. TMED11]
MDIQGRQTRGNKWTARSCLANTCAALIAFAYLRATLSTRKALVKERLQYLCATLFSLVFHGSPKSGGLTQMEFPIVPIETGLPRLQNLKNTP